MTEPIRLLHFADLHIGVKNYGKLDQRTGINSRVLDFLRRMEEMIEYAEVHDVDIAICAGDVFHSRRPTPTHQREFAWRLLDLAKLCPVVLLVGNHDMPTMLEKATSIEIFDTLDVPNVIVGDAYALHHIETKRGPVQVATAPYPHRARLLEGESVSGASIAKLDAELQTRVSRIIEDKLAEEARQSAAPRVLTGHFTVHGAKFGSERAIMAGHDAVVAPGVLARSVWDYVALGHIHKHQNLTRGQSDAPPVVYAGSLERVDFGEEHDDKGFCWVELARDATTWEFVMVNARVFQTVRVDAREVDEPTEYVLEWIDTHLKGKVVRLIIRLSLANETLLREREIRAALRDVGVHYVAAIQKQVERPARIAWEGDAPEAMAPIELLAHYLDSKETPPEHKKQLLEYAEALFGDTLL